MSGQSSHSISAPWEARHTRYVRTPEMWQSAKTPKTDTVPTLRTIGAKAVEMLAAAADSEGQPIEWMLDRGKARKVREE
mgnify:CR=1 FL=1